MPCPAYIQSTAWLPCGYACCTGAPVFSSAIFFCTSAQLAGLPGECQQKRTFWATFQEAGNERCLQGRPADTTAARAFLPDAADPDPSTTSPARRTADGTALHCLSAAWTAQWHRSTTQHQRTDTTAPQNHNTTTPHNCCSNNLLLLCCRYLGTSV